MNLIEIARECDAFKHEYRTGVIYFFYGDDFLKVAQRIEQPLQGRIIRLVDKLNAKDAQVEQLREALKEAALIAKTFIDGYEDLANSVGVFEAEKASIKTARKQLKALEQTK